MRFYYDEAFKDYLYPLYKIRTNVFVLIIALKSVKVKDQTVDVYDESQIRAMKKVEYDMSVQEKRNSIQIIFETLEEVAKVYYQ